MPACSREKRWRPDSVGVSVPVQRADHSGPTPAGCAPMPTSTVGSTRVSAGAPSRSPLLQYSPSSPGPVPDAGASTLLGTSAGSGASPSEPCAPVTDAPAVAARARIPASGVTAAAGTAAFAGATPDDPPLMYVASAPDGPMTATERGVRAPRPASGSVPR